jgi:hypothetical protein
MTIEKILNPKFEILNREKVQLGYGYKDYFKECQAVTVTKPVSSIGCVFRLFYVTVKT